jgi:hypothetical protein
VERQEIQNPDAGEYQEDRTRDTNSAYHGEDNPEASNEIHIDNTEEQEDDLMPDTNGMHDTEDSPEEISALDHTIEKLYQQLQDGFHGCSAKQHEEQLSRHTQSVAEDDYKSLDEVFNVPTFPSVLQHSGFIKPDQIAQYGPTSGAQWKAMFCGIPTHHLHRTAKPVHVCLHKERTQAIEPGVAFDIDSFLGFATSLAMARQGITYQPSSRIEQNMKTDVHVQMDTSQGSNEPDQPPRMSATILKDVPHFQLGRIIGASEITLYILFPYLTRPSSGFTSLTTEQKTRWLDRVFNPAVHQSLEAHYT